MLTWMENISHTTRIKQSMVLMRIALGLFIAYSGWEKIHDPQFAAKLPSMLQGWAATNPIFFYQDFLSGVAAPWASFIAFVVSYGELILGSALVLGIYMNVVTPLTMFLLLNYLLATQHTSTAALGMNAACLLMAFVLFWSGAGQIVGLDCWIAPIKNKKGRRKNNSASRSRRQSAVNANDEQDLKRALKDLKNATKSRKRKKTIADWQADTDDDDENDDWHSDESRYEWEPDDRDEDDDDDDLADWGSGRSARSAKTSARGNTKKSKSKNKNTGVKGGKLTVFSRR